MLSDKPNTSTQEPNKTVISGVCVRAFCVSITQEPLITDPHAYKECGIRDRCLLFVTCLYVSKLQPRRLAEGTTPKLSAGPRRRRPLGPVGPARRRRGVPTPTVCLLSTAWVEFLENYTQAETTAELHQGLLLNF